MTVYLLSGKDMFRQEERLATLLKEFSIDKDYVTTFDASNAKTFRFDEALMACDTFSLFDDVAKKAVIIKEPHFLRASTKTGKKETEKQEQEKDQRLKSLEAYFIVIHSLLIRERKSINFLQLMILGSLNLN